MIYSLVSFAEIAALQDNLKEAQRYRVRALKLARVWVRYEDKGGATHQITVEGNGIGINEAVESKVFRIFHRLGKKLQGNRPGARDLPDKLARHRSKIELESEMSQGAAF